MAEEGPTDSARSIDTVIRGFTDAELALREISGAVERVRSASEQLDASRADQAAAREMLGETSAAMVGIGEKIEALHRTLADATTLLAGLDPERLWRRLEDHTRALRESSDKLDKHSKTLRRVRLMGIAGLLIGAAALFVVVAMATGVLRSG